MKNIFLLSLIAQTQESSLNVLGLIRDAGWLVKGVMALLFLASIVSWVIILWKWMILRTAASESQRFAETFWVTGSLEGAAKASQSNPHAPLSKVFEAGLQEFNAIKKLNVSRADAVELMETNVSRTLSKASSQEMESMQSYLPFLASTASTAPFVGLFGTVWGIMTSFINIGATGASNLAVVAPGIAEALIATAMGLFAAIPAVLFYNYFTNHIRMFSNSLERFGVDFLNTAKRSL